MNLKIPLSAPDVGDREVRYVEEVLRSGCLSLGPMLPRFEEKFATTVGRKYAVAVNSGTSALHLCVRAAGISAGHEVITTSFSFVASTNCLLYESAVPVFVDIDPVTLNISPERIRKFLQGCHRGGRGRIVNPHTGREVKAILPVHVFGLPCEMDEICAIAEEYRLAVIEDSCEAIGATYHGRQAGTFGAMSCFAFYPNKQMTTAEGGMIVTDDARLAKLCRSMRNQGRTEDGSWLQHERIGFNYRLSDVHCAIGLAQLERLSELLRNRDDVAGTYNRVLERLPLIRPLANVRGLKRSWFVYVVQLTVSGADSALRDRVLRRLRRAGIGCQAYFPALHRQPFLEGLVHLPHGRLRETEIAADSCIALPFFSTLKEDQIEFVADELRGALAEECNLPAAPVGPVAANSNATSTLRESI